MRKQKLAVKSLKFGADRLKAGLRTDQGVALVITLLMLSVITFMAIAFLAVSRRERASVTGTLNQADAQAMADAALARAQADLAAFLMAHNTNAAFGAGRANDLLNYDMMMSHNFINPYGFDNSVTPLIRTNVTNVSYVYPTGTALNSDDQIQNIANLFYDPRVPVYIQTNSLFPTNYDFRYWLDYNRNGQFESNGFVREIDVNGFFVDPNGNPTANPPFRTNSVYGEPEFVGVLRQPDVPHGINNNTFIGRWAYLALPIGKTLDLNFIHNYAKATATNGFPASMPNDGYMRNQGHGPWEFNLAGLLFGVNTNLWGTNYLYRVNGAGIPILNQPNSGYAFDDAVTMLSYRYGGNNNNLLPLKSWFQSNNQTLFQTDAIDEYADGPIVISPFDPPPPANDNDDARKPWPGSTNVNNFYEPQDLFEKLQNSQFVKHITTAMAQPDTTNRYTFSRLLASIGTDSDPELYTWVHGDDGKMVKRAKVNINSDNYKQAIAFNNDPVNTRLTTPVVLTNWDPLTFFTNTAELLLRSQEFAIATNLYNATNVPLSSNYIYFGVTNIPVYSTANTNIHYSDAIHRLLQVAANMLDASGNTNTPDRLPSVFRPVLEERVENVNSNLFIPIRSTNVYIIGFTAVTNTNFLAFPFKSLSGITTNAITTNDNVWSVPLVVAARKGFPNFNEYAYSSAFSIERKMEFYRRDFDTRPYQTNQFLTMCISNVFGAELWNSYNINPATGRTFYPKNKLRVWMTNHASISFDYEGGVGTNYSFINTNYAGFLITNDWQGYNLPDSSAKIARAMITLLTNIIPLPTAQWSESKKEFQINPINSSIQINDAPNAFPYHDWVLHITNHLCLLLIDEDTKRIVDAVNIGDFGTSFDVYRELNKDTVFSPFNPSQSARSLVWLTNGANHTTTSPMSLGVSNQIAISAGIISVPTSEWRNTPQDKIASEQTAFRLRLAGKKSDDSTLNFQAPFSPSATLVQEYTWQANDPLVHYTLDDLTGPELTNRVVYLTPMQGTNTIPGNLGKRNIRYYPWPTPDSGVGADVPERMIFRDPLIYSSDEWNFPTNHFPNVGWIGRVHRGSPWQTIYLKAETDPFAIVDDHNLWTRKWTKSITSYPTNDWRFLDLFTVALNENAARGLLSVNQTNIGPWTAALAGMFLLTGTNSGFTIDPYSTNLDGVNIITNIVSGLNQLRASQDNGVFHHVGDILAARELTTSLDIIAQTNLASFPDNVVERLPQQLLSLLKLGDPRFVIYSFGQALKPANNSLVLGGKYRGMCTNYQIAGEVVTRSVVRLSNDSTPDNPKFIIESFNILPGN